MKNYFIRSFLVIISSFLLFSGCENRVPTPLPGLACYGDYFRCLSKCDAQEAQYRNEYSACVLECKNLYKSENAACSKLGDRYAIPACQMGAAGAYQDCLTICLSTEEANLAKVAQARSECENTLATCLANIK
jgi:hypothetical protein